MDSSRIDIPKHLNSDGATTMRWVKFSQSNQIQISFNKCEMCDHVGTNRPVMHNTTRAVRHLSCIWFQKPRQFEMSYFNSFWNGMRTAGNNEIRKVAKSGEGGGWRDRLRRRWKCDIVRRGLKTCVERIPRSCGELCFCARRAWT